jgi:hypothetical protein
MASKVTVAFWLTSDEIGALRGCATSTDGRTLVVADSGREARAAVAGIEPGSPLELEDLLGVGLANQRVGSGVPAWVDDGPVLAGSGDEDLHGGATVWIGCDDQWDRLTGGTLRGPGAQHTSGVTTDDDAVVVVGTAAGGAADWPAGW